MLDLLQKDKHTRQGVLWVPIILGPNSRQVKMEYHLQEILILTVIFFFLGHIMNTQDRFIICGQLQNYWHP